MEWKLTGLWVHSEANGIWLQVQPDELVRSGEIEFRMPFVRRWTKIKIEQYREILERNLMLFERMKKIQFLILTYVTHMTNDNVMNNNSTAATPSTTIKIQHRSFHRRKKKWEKKLCISVHDIFFPFFALLSLLSVGSKLWHAKHSRLVLLRREKQRNNISVLLTTHDGRKQKKIQRRLGVVTTFCWCKW